MAARVWRRRRSLDAARPAGRTGWLRRGRSRATAVLARVVRRGPRTPGLAAPMGTVTPSAAIPGAATPRVGLATVPGLRSVPGLSGVPRARRPRAEDEAVPVTIPLLPGDRSLRRRFLFGVANSCTLASLGLGLLAIFLAIDGDLRLAAATLLGCVIFDGCDGSLARRFGVASPFGGQMDSLSDLSSFGVATGVVNYLWLVHLGARPLVAGVACALLAACAAIRLARFNVSPKNGRFFSGVPTTMAAAVLALNMLGGPSLPARVEVLVVAAWAIAMVASFPYPKLASVARMPLWWWVFPAICAMISVSGTFALLALTYLASGPLLWLVLRDRRTALPR